MSNTLEALKGKKVFLHWKLQEAGYAQYIEDLKMEPVRDVFEPDLPPIETRFLRSGADIALVSTLPFILEASEELLESKVLRSRGVLVAHKPNFNREKQLIEFNKSLKDTEFLYLWIDQVNDNHTLASLFLKALQNV